MKCRIGTICTLFNGLEIWRQVNLALLATSGLHNTAGLHTQVSHLLLTLLQLNTIEKSLTIFLLFFLALMNAGTPSKFQSSFTAQKNFTWVSIYFKTLELFEISTSEHVEFSKSISCTRAVTEPETHLVKCLVNKYLDDTQICPFQFLISTF